MIKSYLVCWHTLPGYDVAVRQRTKGFSGLRSNVA